MSMVVREFTSNNIQHSIERVVLEKLVNRLLVIVNHLISPQRLQQS